jgi:uncharacterized protein
MAPDRQQGLILTEARFPGRAPIDAYGNGGFRFADMSHRGSILALPGGIEAWPVTAVDMLTPDSLSPVLRERSDIEILLFGTGTVFQPLPDDAAQVLEESGLAPDLMNTGAAVRTYNVLLAEGRAVAAALIAVDTPR